MAISKEFWMPPAIPMPPRPRSLSDWLTWVQQLYKVLEAWSISLTDRIENLILVGDDFSDFPETELTRSGLRQIFLQKDTGQAWINTLNSGIGDWTQIDSERGTATTGAGGTAVVTLSKTYAATAVILCTIEQSAALPAIAVGWISSVGTGTFTYQVADGTGTGIVGAKVHWRISDI